MSTLPLRPLLSAVSPTASSLRHLKPVTVVAGSFYQSSSFASSSKSRLSQTSPRRMATSQSPLEDSFPQLAEDAAAVPSSPGRRSSLATPTTPSQPAATPRPNQPEIPKVMPTITRSFAPSTPSSSSGSNAPSRRAGPVLRYAPGANDTAQGITHDLHILSTRNNLLLTFSDRIGPVWPTISAGTDKTFKNSGRSSYEAAHQASLKMFDKVLNYVRDLPSRGGSKSVQIRLAFRGLSGQGGEAFSQALGGNDGVEVRRLIARVEDRTGVKIGGTRPRKARRL